MYKPCFDITHDRTEESSVVAYFNGTDHTEAYVTVMIIDTVSRTDSTLKKIREIRWLRTRGSSWPAGMNLQADGL